MNNIDCIHSKIINLELLKMQLVGWNFKNYTIVFTNGCFDILHKGHIEYLAKAADMGHILIVGLNTDDSIKRLKGKNRPVFNEQSRSLMLASLRFIDAVVLFNEDTPYELIKLVQPDILVKGADYKIEQIVGYDIVLEKGGKVETIELTEGYSTSELIKKLQS